MALKTRFSLLAAAALLATAAAQPADSPLPPPALSYADMADLALPASVAAHVRLRRAVPLRPEEAVGVAAGKTRFYVEAEVLALIRGEPGSPSQVSFLVDLPNDARGRPARPERRSEWLIFARPVTGRPGELVLAAPDAMVAFHPASADQVRAILGEALAGEAAPALIGIGRAFHVPGALPDTGETQIFLQTADEQPISITVQREAEAQPRWFVSLSEFVSAGAAAPQRETLLWYRLACFLPERLPPASLADAGNHASRINADYRLVREGLGACPRTRTGG